MKGDMGKDHKRRREGRGGGQLVWHCAPILEGTDIDGYDLS